MAKKKETTMKDTPKKMRPATAPEARENQLIALAVDLAEKQLMPTSSTSLKRSCKSAYAPSRGPSDREQGSRVYIIYMSSSSTFSLPTSKR